MKLISLTLKNFKGIRDFTFEPNGANAAILGNNGAGKTTVADACYWLLFGKDSQNRKQFEIKTLDKDGNALHGAEHTVRAVFEIDGQMLELRKTYKEVWTKKRGSADREFSGHTTDYYIHEVPVQEKEYLAKIAGICDEQRFRLLTDTTFFNTHLEWKERRRILIDKCGDVTDSDVISSNPGLASLPKILGPHKIDDYRKIIIARRKECNEKRESLPVRIDEVRRAMPETAIVPDVSGLRSDLQELQEKRAQAAAGGSVAEATKELREAEAELQGLANAIRDRQSAGFEESRAAYQVKARERDAAISEKRSVESEIASAEIEYQSLTRKREDLLAQFAREDAKSFEFTGKDSCAACGQPLPADKVEAARQKALENFNELKSKGLETIREAGKGVSSRRDAIGAKLAEARDSLPKIETRIEMLTEELQGMENPKTEAPDFSADPAYSKQLTVIEGVKSRIQKLQADSSADLAEYDQLIASLQSDIAESDRLAAGNERRTESLARISELEAEEKKLAASFEQYERELFLLDEFVRTKVRMLTDRINSQFAIARFRLFREQVDGSLVECCDTVVDGVPWESLNHGTKVNAGLDIVRSLQDHYKFHPIVILDNSESTTSFLEMDCQVIKLVVSASDKTLRVELDPTSYAAVARHDSTPQTPQETLL